MERNHSSLSGESIDGMRSMPLFDSARKDDAQRSRLLVRQHGITVQTLHSNHAAP